jgi:hypothetical protein
MFPPEDWWGFLGEGTYTLTNHSKNSMVKKIFWQTYMLSHIKAGYLFILYAFTYSIKKLPDYQGVRVANLGVVAKKKRTKRKTIQLASDSFIILGLLLVCLGAA